MHSASNNINDNFFEGAYKHAWKKTIPEGLTQVETSFILEICSLHEGTKVLDFMCGYGRHAIELAKKGIRVTALDNLDYYIQEIETKAKDENLPIKAIRENIASAKLDELYNAAVCMGNSFAFFDKEAGISILKNIADHLHPGGYLIINSWTIAEIAIRHFKERDWHYAGDYKCILENKFRFQPSRIESEQLILSKNGETEVVKGIDYIFSLDELELMFSEAGLKTEALYSTPKKRQFVLGDGQIYIVAKKINR